MSGVGPLSQDWEPVVLRKKAPTAAARKDEKAVNAARRSGADIDTIKKCSLLSFNFFNRISIFGKRIIFIFFNVLIEASDSVEFCSD